MTKVKNLNYVAFFWTQGDAEDSLLLKLLGVQMINLDVLSEPPPLAAERQRALNCVLYLHKRKVRS